MAPLHFLMTTTRAAGSIRETLGGATYSYHFVTEVLRPLFERLGACTTVDRPESRLSWLARSARARGEHPIHIAINPLQDVYLASDVPNIVYPFWEFPRIPDQDFGTDTRQNWTRVARSASLILTACQFTADAIRSAGIDTPIVILPLPVPEWTRRLPPWNRGRSTSLRCRWIELEGARAIKAPVPLLEPVAEDTRSRSWPYKALRFAYHQLTRLLGKPAAMRLAGLRRAFREQTMGQALLTTARAAYRHSFKRWINQDAQARITARKEALLRGLSIPGETLDPEIPSSEIELQGIVYTTFISIGDPRKNPRDLLSAFLTAFRDRDDVTLVIKLATNRRAAFTETQKLRSLYDSMGIEHRCRIVAIADYLDDSQVEALMNVSTYYVNTSHAEGACMPLQQALAAGRPAIAPAHTAMREYIDDEVAFVVGSDEEPCAWPHDPEQRLVTTRHRLHWNELRDAFLRSEWVARHQYPIYERMANAARDRMQSMCDIDRNLDRMKAALMSVVAVEEEHRATVNAA